MAFAIPARLYLAKGKKMKNKANLLPRLASLMLILSIFTVITFESIHIGHEEHCHEENCPVCLALQIIKNNSKKTDTPVCSNIVFHFVFEILLIGLFSYYFIIHTPVTKKIKLTI